MSFYRGGDICRKQGEGKKMILHDAAVRIFTANKNKGFT
jgi:hypothetical protein